MDWMALQQKMPKDSSMSDRSFVLETLEKVLEGRHYDTLPFPFSKERSDSGDYIPLDERRPSVRTGLCRVVVEDSVSLLFGEGHWPSIRGDNESTLYFIEKVIRECKINDVMLEAATRGSVGSVAILLKVIQCRPFVTVMSTKFLTPKWRYDNPSELDSIVECYKVNGKELVKQGFEIDANLGIYWFKRMWDNNAEVWFHPTTVDNNTEDMIIDPLRTIIHGLGFVPIVWIRNISGNGGHEIDGPDGTCTFAASIDTVIEADYLLSQAGRGLKYGSDPTLVLKNSDSGIGAALPARIGGAAVALTLPPEGDAKLLEINGNAAAAVLAHVKELRAIALEAIHGNRAHGDKAGSSQSGRAIELMCQGLIWLADRLRISYGDGGLLPLLNLFCRASSKISSGLLVAGVRYRSLDATGLTLVWPSWFPASYTDLQAQANSVSTLLQNGIIDQKEALSIIAPLYGLSNFSQR